MISTFATKNSCEEIEKRIEDDAKVFGLMMKKHFPFSKNLSENGFEVKEHASTFELCKAPLAAKLLNTHPELNALLPCRICVYEKDGVAFASTPDLKFQLENLVCQEEMKNEILDLYDKITTMIKGW